MKGTQEDLQKSIKIHFLTSFDCRIKVQSHRCFTFYATVAPLGTLYRLCWINGSLTRLLHLLKQDNTQLHPLIPSITPPIVNL